MAYGYANNPGAYAGCNTGSSPVETAAPQPTCSITEFARGVPFGGSPASHTYLQIVDPELGASGTNDILEGGTTNPHSPFRRKAAWGNLTGIISGTNGATNPSPLRGDNTATNTVLGSDIGGASVCAQAAQLLTDVQSYNRGAQPGYSPLPNGTSTFNSNSFTYTLLSQVGLAGIFGQAAWSPGWGFLVPGL